MLYGPNYFFASRCGFSAVSPIPNDAALACKKIYVTDLLKLKLVKDKLWEKSLNKLFMKKQNMK